MIEYADDLAEMPLTTTYKVTTFPTIALEDIRAENIYIHTYIHFYMHMNLYIHILIIYTYVGIAHT